MTDIPNTEYITIKRDDKGMVGVFVGEKPATTYRGQEIEHIELINKFFVLLQKHNPQITEFHAGAFATKGEYDKTGNPDGEFGQNAWCRVVSKKTSPSDLWVFDMVDGSAEACARGCAYYCLGQVCYNEPYRCKVLSLIKDSANKKMSIKLKLPRHIITIEKRNKQM